MIAGKLEEYRAKRLHVAGVTVWAGEGDDALVHGVQLHYMQTKGEEFVEGTRVDGDRHLAAAVPCPHPRCIMLQAGEKIVRVAGRAGALVDRWVRMCMVAFRKLEDRRLFDVADMRAFERADSNSRYRRAPMTYAASASKPSAAPAALPSPALLPMAILSWVLRGGSEGTCTHFQSTHMRSPFPLPNLLSHFSPPRSLPPLFPCPSSILPAQT